MLKLLARRFSCQRGATALEFAMVLPMLMLVLLGMVEFLLIIFASTVIDGAAREASRVGSTGYSENFCIIDKEPTYPYNPTHKCTAEELKNAIDNTMRQRMGPVLFNSSALHVDMQAANGSDLSGARTCYNADGTPIKDRDNHPVCGSGQLALFTVSYDWDYLTPISMFMSAFNHPMKLQTQILVLLE